MITDMTEGSPAKLLWRFSIPLFLSVIFQQFYNIADSVVAGQFVGENALAAVGTSYPITMIFMAVATGANIGCSVIISQLFGAKDYSRMKTAVSTSLISCLALSLILTVAGVFLSSPLMQALNTPGDIFGDAELYLQVYVWGLVFLFLYNVCTGIFTALGDSKTPLYFLIASSLSNIGLDILFVTAFQMGVAGVAWATFLCQGVASVLAALTLFKRLRAIETPYYAKFSGHMLGNISKVAVPSILQQSFVSVGNLLIQGLVNSFGPAVIAGYSASIKINTFAITSISTLSNGLSSYTAQNVGARKVERVRQGARATAGMSAGIIAAFIALLLLLSRQLVGLFMDNPSQTAMSVGVEFLQVVVPFYAILGCKFIFDGVLRGSGSMICFMIGTFLDLIIRVVLSFVLTGSMGPAGIFYAWPAGWVVSTILAGAFYFTGIWKRRWKQPEMPPEAEEWAPETE
ncbi:MATE family efflux transporter [Christensenellaceae bacterium NSJ-63]|uniref:MATE family efflux transporter n=1 Tax=Guopingia tenuis TaxID=2763656 RepID=A0A926HXW4_9FIRM|nr:MATE family efflux transporter [Guopingia tenuis]MBC8539166.1 MATE family efflux transporter [Guopingia tenuis]